MYLGTIERLFSDVQLLEVKNRIKQIGHVKMVDGLKLLHSDLNGWRKVGGRCSKLPL